MVEAVAVRDISQELQAIFDGTGRVVDKVKRAEQLVLSDNSLTDWGTGTEYTKIGKEAGKSRVFLKKLMPYGFEMISILYKMEAKEQTYTREERNEFYRNHYRYNWSSVPYSLSVPIEGTERLVAVYQLTYNLRDKIHVVNKNGKFLNFNENNIKNMFASHRALDLMKKLDKLNIEQGWDTANEKDTGMYTYMFHQLASIGDEWTQQTARFLERFMWLNKVELLYKAGLPNRFVSFFITDIAHKLQNKRIRLLTYNPDTTKPHKVLGIPKNLYHLVKIGVIDYSRLVEWSENIQYLDPNSLRKASATICGVYNYCLEFDEQYGLEKAKSIVNREGEAIIASVNSGSTEELTSTKCTAIAQFLGVPLKQVIEYACYRLDVEQGFECYRGDYNGYSGASSIYRDYLTMGHQLQARKNNFPQNLKTQHDIFARNIAVLKDKELAESFKMHRERMETWANVAIRGAEFTMVAPKSLEDIAQEGSRMRHCVASYAKRVAKGETNILFLREKGNEEECLVTVEVAPCKDENFEYKILQAKQADNVPITKEQKEFLCKWADKLGFKMSSWL